MCQNKSAYQRPISRNKRFVWDNTFGETFDPCQHLAGCSVVEKFVAALCDPGDHYNVLVDLMGFDGWPAAYAVGEICKGNKWACGTVCHCSHETNFVAEITCNKLFSLARDNKLKIPGFPDFKAVISDLKKSNQTTAPPQYAVCTPLADGGLVVKSALIDLWTKKNEGFQDEADPWHMIHMCFFGPHLIMTRFLGRSVPAQ